MTTATHGGLATPEPRAASGMPTVVGVRMVAMGVGIVAGAVGFVGFFLDFFNHSNTALYQASSSWFDLIPAFIGAATLALLLPRYLFALSGLSLGAMGIAFGIRGTVAGLAGLAPRLSPDISYGVGFWMIVLGAVVLMLAWAVVVFEEMRLRMGAHAH